MGVAVAKSRKSAWLTRLFGATALTVSVIGAAPLGFAQELGPLGADVPAGSQMLLEADTLIYDQDNDTVTAEGAVRIEYGGNRIVAQRVSYNRKTSRVTASGDVQLIDDEGTKIYTEEIDITDDFSDGFVNALRVETIDKTYFAAESAERREGRITTFTNGVYTACAPCEEHPDRPPIWRVKARKIIWNAQEKVIRFERSRFEFFGLPIAYFPAFEIPDPTVKRKSGFLIPGITYKTELGVGLTVPYYLALAPTYDLTLMPTYYTKQGFLGQAEWRQRFERAEYSIRVAGIQQQEPDVFRPGGINAGTLDDPNKFRGMVGSRGQYRFNPRWSFNWDFLLQTDKNFSKTYAIAGYAQTVRKSDAQLVGLHDRNYFDLSVMRFDVQEDLPNSNLSSRDNQQPWVLPSFDYSYTPDEPVAGGELNIDVNARVLGRDRLDDTEIQLDRSLLSSKRVPGIEGDSSRLTAEAEWKRTYYADGGIVVTPMFQVQGDATKVDASSRSVAAIEAMAANPAIDAGTEIRSAYNRYMATAGLEVRWPVLFSSTSSSHILEPTAQVFIRPDEGYRTGLGMPNEDAQSFVFDASTLFERDKFSGYDRIEGGSRANVGFRYSGAYDNGFTTNALFGQSYHLAGLNSFDAPDLVNAGAFSGLETDTSDFVGLVGFTSPLGVSASLSGRFDEQTLEMRRTEIKAAYVNPRFSVTGQYAFIQAQPLYGFNKDRREAYGGATLRFTDNWSVFGSAIYDLESNTLTQDSIGVSYLDECFTYTMSFTEQRSEVTDKVKQSFGFNIAFRTLGDFGSSTAALDQFRTN